MTEALRRTEAKAYFANERTFLHWLNVAVTIGSISAAMLGVSGHAHRHMGVEVARNAIVGRVLALLMMLTAIGVALYASYLFAYRASLLKFKMDTGYESKVLPLTLTVIMLCVLASIFLGAVETYRTERAGAAPPSPPAAGLLGDSAPGDAALGMLQAHPDNVLSLSAIES